MGERAGASTDPRDGERLHIFGVPVDRLTPAQALRRAAALLATPGPGPAALVLTPNPELIMQARRDPALLAATRAAALALPDGVGVVWAARRLGRPCPARIPGVEFMVELLGLAARTGSPVYFLGARPEVVRAAAARARERFPALEVAGAADGYFRPEEAAQVAARIAGSGARLLLVGMGVPAQERFLHRWAPELGRVRLAMAVGGSFDVLSGHTRRAPRLVGRIGLEWLWRLAGQPRRWRRQLALPRFALAILREGR